VTFVYAHSSALSKFSSPAASELCGAFSGLFGPADAAVLIWRHNSFDDANGLRLLWSDFAKSKN
jgi:hypothetical protein